MSDLQVTQTQPPKSEHPSMGVWGLVLACLALVGLSATTVIGGMSVAFGIAGDGSIIPIAWIVAALLNVVPLVVGGVAVILGFKSHTTVGKVGLFLGVAAVAISVIVVLIFVLVGLANLG